MAAVDAVGLITKLVITTEAVNWSETVPARPAAPRVLEYGMAELLRPAHSTIGLIRANFNPGHN